MSMASTLCSFFKFFSSFEHAKHLLIMGLDNTKNSSKSVILSYLTMNSIVRILLLSSKTPNLMIKLFLCFVSRPRVGPINSKHKFQMREHFCRHLHSSLISMRLSQGACPLLMDPRKYNADTVDLCRDDDARDYW
jgi:hypothetical protein